MEKKPKEIYEAPECAVLCLRLEGMIAASAPIFNSAFDDEEDL